MVPKFEKRVRAFSIDTASLMLVLILTMFLNPLLRNILLAIMFFIIYILPYLISKGQTFGKRIQKIKVVKVDGSDVNTLIVILRQLFILLVIAITFGIYLIVAFFFLSEKETSRTIHDYIFKTKMIDLSPVDYKDDYLNKTESMTKRGL